MIFRRCRIKRPAQFRVALLALQAAFLMAGCRQDMQNQPKMIPLRSTEFYPDRRSARYPMAGTVPKLEDAVMDREQLDPGSYFLTGRRGPVFGNDLPFPLTLEVMKRGQERFNIYCAPCHSQVGDGNGMIVQRGFKHPPTFHQQRLRNAPLGHFYEVISGGWGAMPDYAAQIKPEDRWKIAAYIRALQRSQNPEPDDVTAADREKLNAPPETIVIPDTSYTSPTALKPEKPAAPPPPRGDQQQ
ncbi:MAG TPA: cytochrome c [Candidatus Angelobacter sp.]